MRLRCCNLVYDGSMIAYSQQNRLNAAVVAFAVYLGLDVVIMVARVYFAYILQYEIETDQKIIQETVENPMFA